LTVLGVTFNNTLSYSPHIQNVTAKAATTLYALQSSRFTVYKERPCEKLHGQPS